MRCLAFTPDGRLLSGGEDKTVRLWDVDGAKVVRELKGHTTADTPPATKALAFTPSGTVLASGGQDRRLILWDVKTGVKQREWHLEGEVRALAFAPDGRHLVVGNDDGTLYVLRLL